MLNFATVQLSPLTQNMRNLAKYKTLNVAVDFLRREKSVRIIETYFALYCL
jgi:hypothetical protein